MDAKRTLHLAVALVGSSLASSGAFLVACSSSSNPTPVEPTYNLGDGGDAGDATTASPESGTVQESGALPESGETAQDAASDVASDAGCTPQLTDASCWACPALSDGSLQYLNQCSGTGVRCVPFSNAVLPGYDAGGLPAL